MQQKERQQQMIIKKQILYIILFLFLFTRVCGQDYESLCKKALLMNLKGKKYAYASDTNSVHVTYLGIVNTIKHKQYKIVSIKNVWGINKHTNAYIWIYNSNNKYVGRYVLGDARDLPIYIKRGSLIFSNKDKNCNTTIQKKISFVFGIPQKIFIPACDLNGDIYEFNP
jgi:hypothetical protein